jgi:endonuclease/exonuclease/phosphatase family metal-dependent hydrolase
LEHGSGEDFQVVLSEQGGHDRVGLAWRASRFDREDAPAAAAPQVVPGVEGPFEWQGQTLRFRPSVYVRLRDRLNGRALVLCASHLARSNRSAGPAMRRRQAELLRGWLQHFEEPVILVGDFNFDFDLERGDTDNSGYTTLTQGDVFRWARPAQLVGTHSSREGGAGRSVLDFVFVANGARSWPYQSQIVTRPDDFSPPERASDHRPVRTVFQLPR